ncbi:AAA family ATPase [Frankia sp. CNm7]|uniref:AAA family ATPase n=1 Tax=Frankia nepalensis TaxID=1836974 RepID=A0A937UVQ5_9ACTN|nr:BTAD domain-containing putative transcriptional regulator [Frankia nepalensis]MBL7499933.1 AAA family ATPase [Frankia nepalensis]MBL7511704.1 AAA family ATPase [Frankia nepalensis]MBL7523031.1 AAA family ATPase [Frankia nepalensis]MBL7632536.1 AAA family ATPase [Frankia nepalensis]
MVGGADSSTGGSADPARVAGRGPADETLRINVLGDLTVSRDGVALDVGGRRQRAVLGLLVLARGDAVPANRLIDLLWENQPPPGATGALQSYVSHLRRRIEPDRDARSRGSVIVRMGPGYALTVGPDVVDAWRFEQLVRRASTGADPAGRVATLVDALELWRGPAFAEYRDESWTVAEVARLTELREVAREQLVEARLGCGETAVVVPEIEALVAEQPLREERWRLLVLALYRSHRQGDALGALRRARAVLADELGVDPGPALRALEAEVLSHAPSLVPTSPSLVAASAPVPAPAAMAAPARPDLVPAARSSGPDSLVDRDREVAELAACVADARDGQARLVVIEGPAGIGKTRLLAEARRLAATHTARIFTARGSQLEKEYGFGAVRQLFEAAVAAPPPGQDLLAGAAARAAMVFDVEPATPAEAVAPLGPAAGSPQRADGSLAVLHGLYWLTVRLAADGPVMLAIDDLQWCDSASLRFLSYLVRRAEGLPILIVATLRTGEPHDDEGLLAELTHDPGTVLIGPGPLTAAGVADLVRGRLGDAAEDAFVAACHRTTAGNPLLLRQLLRALQAEGVRPDATHADTVRAIGSRAVSSLVLMRLARLAQESTAVARWIAILGNGAALPIVAALAGLSEAGAAAAVGTLARAEVLRDEYPLGFVHPLVADAVYRDLPPGERQLHHDRAARVLHETGATPEQVAAHLLQVPHRSDPWVIEVLRQAANRASDRGAPDAAATYLVRALQEQQEPTVRALLLVDLGRVEAISKGVAAVPHLAEAYEALEPGAQRAQVGQMLARTLVFAGTPGEATRFALQAVAELPPGLDDERQGLLGLARIGGYMHDLDPGIWRRGPEPAVAGDGPGARMLAAALAWERVVDGTDRAKAIELARFANGDGVLTRVDIGLLWAVAGVVLLLAGEETEAMWDDGLSHSYQRGTVFGALATHLWRGHLEWERGELREARQSFQIVTEQSQVWGMPFGTGYSDSYAIGVLVDQGDLAAARALVDRVHHESRFAEGARLFGEMHARLLVAEGRHEEALASVEEVRAVMARVRNPAWRPWRSLRARALAGLGRHEEAVALVEDELALARAWGAPIAVGRTLRVLGELRGADGLAELREAAAALEPTWARLEHARALRALAMLSPPAQAVPMLGRAAELAWRCGAAGLYRQVAGHLAEAGEPLAPRAPTAATLTFTERQIVTRHLAGASESEIAEALFLTPRTVRLYLTAARQRLGATSPSDPRRNGVGGPA